MFSAINGFAGTQPFNDWFTPDTTQRHVLGTKVVAVDPYWGLGTFMYIKSADAILKGSLVMWDETFNGALLPNTANQGFPLAVAMAPMASGVYGWVQLEGRAVYKTNATVAADTAIGITAAGIAGTLAAGKQLVGVRNRVAATGTTTVTALTQNGTNVLYCAKGYDGFFLGMALSGTGIPASTVVAGLDPDGRRIYTGSAIGTFGDKNSTATGSITLTGTYTGYGSGVINYPYAQGAIT
jgi:hypothetical protein